MSGWIRDDPESQALLAEELRLMAEADHAPNPRYKWIEELAWEVGERRSGVRTEREAFAYADAMALIIKRLNQRIELEQCNPPIRRDPRPGSSWRNIPHNIWALIARGEVW